MQNQNKIFIFVKLGPKKFKTFFLCQKPLFLQSILYFFHYFQYFYYKDIKFGLYLSELRIFQNQPMRSKNGFENLKSEKKTPKNKKELIKLKTSTYLTFRKCSICLVLWIFFILTDFFHILGFLNYFWTTQAYHKTFYFPSCINNYKNCVFLHQRH